MGNKHFHDSTENDNNTHNKTHYVSKSLSTLNTLQTNNKKPLKGMKLVPPLSMNFINIKSARNSGKRTPSTGYISNITPISNASSISPSPTTSYDNINKFTQRILSDRILQLCSNFWSIVENVSMNQRLEMGLAIFFGLITNDLPAKQILITNCKTSKQMQSMGLKFLDMIAWSVKAADRPYLNYDTFNKLIILHNKMDLNIKCYKEMLQQIHEVFTFYFPEQYTAEIRFAFDELFVYSTQIMTGIDLKTLNPLQDYRIFCRSYSVCMQSNIGKEYLFRYLHQVACDETVIFLQLLNKYKQAMDDKSRFKIAKDINRICIVPEGVFVINISYDARIKVMRDMMEYENISEMNKEFTMDKKLFVDVESEICRLIIQTHWRKFKRNMNELYVD